MNLSGKGGITTRSSSVNTRIRTQPLAASESYLTRVINHGVSKDLMDEALKIFKEFHAMPPKEKLNECSKDPNGRCKFYTSSENCKRDRAQYWKDTIIHPCPPSGEYTKYWPQRPPKYREIVGKYTQELRKLGLEILERLCEGLGLSPGYFYGGLGENPRVVSHHYPPCPDPSLTLGTGKHRDPSIITILLQDKEVQALQVLKDGEWIVVEPIPNAFVISIGLLLQIISNGRIVGAEHRVVTNLIYPSCERIIEPAQELINGSTPPIYKSISFGEFSEKFLNRGPKIEEELQS